MLSRAQPQGQRSLVHNALLAGERQRIRRRRLRHLSRLYLVDAWPQLACGDAAVCSNSVKGLHGVWTAGEAQCGTGLRGYPKQRDESRTAARSRSVASSQLATLSCPLEYPPVMNSRPLSASYAMPFSTSGPPLRAAAAGLPPALAASASTFAAASARACRSDARSQPTTAPVAGSTCNRDEPPCNPQGSCACRSQPPSCLHNAAAQQLMERLAPRHSAAFASPPPFHRHSCTTTTDHSCSKHADPAAPVRCSLSATRCPRSGPPPTPARSAT